MEKYPGKKRVAVFISGRGSNLKSLIKYSHKNNSLIKIILVISNNPNAKGLKYSTKSKIKSYGIKFKSCLAGFMNILSGSFIRKYSKPILNIHPSLLPKYKGLNTHLRAIKNKDKYSGASVHKVTEKLDSGKIIFQKKVKISKKDTELSLAKKILVQAHKLYPKAILKVFNL